MKDVNCRCEEHDSEVKIEIQILADLIHYARRYCDGRATYAPTEFNRIYDSIRAKCIHILNHDQFDETLKDKGAYWPYAQDGMYDQRTGSYNAI